MTKGLQVRGENSFQPKRTPLGLVGNRFDNVSSAELLRWARRAGMKMQCHEEVEHKKVEGGKDDYQNGSPRNRKGVEFREHQIVDRDIPADLGRQALSDVIAAWLQRVHDEAGKRAVDALLASTGAPKPPEPHK